MSSHTASQQRTTFGFLLLLPAVLVLGALGAFPLLGTFWLSLTDAWAGSTATPQWVGLGNYRELFGRQEFLLAVRNTLVFTVISVTLELLLGFAMALLLNLSLPARGLLRGIALLPWALPTVVAARLWGWMLHDVYGVANDLLVRRLHVLAEPVAFLGSDAWAMAALILTDVWKTTPFVAVLLLAALQGIPRELYEAAAVDGAGVGARLRRITLPLLLPSIIATVLLRTIDALRMFDMAWVMTQGRFGTETLGTLAYRQLFDFSRLGYGSAVCVVLFAVVATATAASLARSAAENVA